MFWKLFKLQQLLDTLFDDSWFNLGLPLDDEGPQDHDGPFQPRQA